MTSLRAIIEFLRPALKRRREMREATARRVREMYRDYQSDYVWPARTMTKEEMLSKYPPAEKRAHFSECNCGSCALERWKRDLDYRPSGKGGAG